MGLVVAPRLLAHGVDALRPAARGVDGDLVGEDAARVVEAVLVEPQSELADQIDDRLAIGAVVASDAPEDRWHIQRW
jgi:hypothetical protein